MEYWVAGDIVERLYRHKKERKEEEVRWAKTEKGLKYKKALYTTADE
jgi:hypothetical protein